MDEAVLAGKGGFETRNHLIVEAISNLLDELDFPEDGHELPAEPNGPGGGGIARPPIEAAQWLDSDTKLKDLVGTALEKPVRPAALADSNPSPPRGPMLGLHNRDYVSLWALSRLASYTTEGPIAFDQYLKRVTEEAWSLGLELEQIENRSSFAITTLFPTNRAKVPSAERGFQTFAVGSIGRNPGHAPKLAGPLFVWNAVGIVDPTALSVSPTEAGMALLQELAGISLVLPHSVEHADKFFLYLRRHAPTDYLGFEILMRLVHSKPDRQALVAGFQEADDRWSNSTASSIAQGYVSRAREWGLIAERLQNGRYESTTQGEHAFPVPDQENQK